VKKKQNWMGGVKIERKEAALNFENSNPFDEIKKYFKNAHHI
jgi:hypothetical protein